MKKFFVFTAIMLVLSISLCSEPVSSISIDWQNSLIHLSVIHQVDEFTPEGRSRLQRDTIRNLGDRFISAAKKLRISSALSLEEWINRNPRRISDLLGAAEKLEPVSSNFSREFGELIFTFQLPLFPDFAAVFLDHSRGYTPLPGIFHAPSANYTGILIYARDTYPVFGEEESAEIVPVLFPRIWDEEMNLVFEPEMMDRADILSQGAVGYFTSLSAEGIEERVGPNPLRISARGLFGVVPSDPIILRTDALSLINSPQANEIRKKGRIAFIVDE